MKNTLYYGDNLEILRKYIKDESVDLIYLDPPFNSEVAYNITFKESNGSKSKAQAKAYEDTWKWGLKTDLWFEQITELSQQSEQIGIIKLMNGLIEIYGESNMMSYLTMMCIRLLELKRVLKDTGSIYLHCDSTASHYLKLVLDAIFGEENFKNEIIWRRRRIRSNQERFSRSHDIIFLYTKDTDKCKFNANVVRIPYEESSFNTCKKDEKGRYFYKLYGKTYYLHSNGKLCDDVWIDIKSMAHLQNNEYLGYDTQKPLLLLERIILASSDKGDTVLDPFVGSGTTVVKAQEFNRNWIGIDITHLSTSLVKWRLENNFEGIKYQIVGEPVDLSGAKQLALQDRYEFQWWATALIGASPYDGRKKGADGGIDGFYHFRDGGKLKEGIVSIKSGGISLNDIKNLSDTVNGRDAAMGLFITLNSPTKPMVREAEMKGFYKDFFGSNEYKKIQILTIEQIFSGRKFDVPQRVSIYKGNIVKKKTIKTTQKRI